MNKTALLLIDLQNDYFTGGANPLVNSEEAVLNAQRILHHFRSQQWPVFHVQHIAVSPGATFFLRSTRGAEIHPAVSPLSSERVITKHYPNSFRATSLLTDLKSIPVAELVIAGMMTHMCVDATVRAARDHGFAITLIADACATKDLQYMTEVVGASDVHHAFVAALNGFYATVQNTAQFLPE